MKCGEALLLIQTSLDRSLEPGERVRLDDHAATCAPCRQAWSEYRALDRDAVFLAAPHAVTPADEAYAAALMQRIKHRNSAAGSVPVLSLLPPGRPNWFAPMLASLACLALLPVIVRLDPSAFSAHTWTSSVLQLRLTRLSENLDAYMPDGRGWGVQATMVLSK